MFCVQIYGMNHLQSPAFGPLVWPLYTPNMPVIHLAQLLLRSLMWFNTLLFPLLTSLARLITSYLFPHPPLLLSRAHVQGTKGLLESAALPALLSTSCPQMKPQTAYTCPDSSPAVNSDPSPQLSTSCGARHTASSQGDTSPPRHTKTRSKKRKLAALNIPNPSFDVPVSPTSPDAGPSSKARGSFTPLHWLKWQLSKVKNTLCVKLACCDAVRHTWYEFKNRY